MTKDRLNSESAFHDRQARLRAGTFLNRPDLWYFNEDDYLDHESWIRPAIEKLGSLQDLRVLDFGCGHGMAALVFARNRARVTGLDLSLGYLTEARLRVRANGLNVHFVQCNGERLPFLNSSFDRIWGNAILHHLDIQAAGEELFRVLAPKGVAVFAEPWGENLFLNWARRRLSYPGKGRTPDEEPLRQKDIRILQGIFPHVELEGHQFLSMVRRVLQHGRWLANLEGWDRELLRRVPRVQQYCRYIVLTLRK
jgi:SAM-dependent methyltransferase